MNGWTHAAVAEEMPSHRARNVACVAIGVLGLAWLKVVYHAWTAGVALQSWTVGDWLINYGGGVVRRGASGELIALLAPEGHLVALLFVLKSVAYLLPFLVAIRWVWRQRATAGVGLFLVLLSPAGLLFPALDPLAGGRKEILLIALASACVWRSQRRRRWMLGWGGASLLAAGLALLLMMHEGLVFFMPLLLLVLSACVTYRPAQAAFVIVVVALVFLAIVVCSRPPDVSLICLRIHDLGIDLSECLPGGGRSLDDGPMAWMPLSGMDAFKIVISRITPWGLVSLALILPACFLPLVLLPKSVRRIYLFRALIAVGAVLPLFLVSLDWGRWLSVVYMLLFLLVVALMPASEPSVHRAGAAPTALMSWAQVALIAIWPWSWRLKSCCAAALTSGYAAQLTHFLH